MKFFKGGCNGGEEKFLLEMGACQEWGVSCFFNGRMGIKFFKISLHSWQRVVTPLFYKDLPILPITSPFSILPTYLPPPTSAPTVLSAVLFLWLFYLMMI